MARRVSLTPAQPVSLAKAAQAADSLEAGTDLANRLGSTTSVVCPVPVRGDIVYGPAGAVDTEIALFDGATGYLIKDSGIPVSVLASLTESGRFTRSMLLMGA